MTCAVIFMIFGSIVISVVSIFAFWSIWKDYKKKKLKKSLYLSTADFIISQDTPRYNI